MIRAFRSWLTARRFKQAFAAELQRVETERRRHAQVRRAQDELQARVHSVLARKGGA
jgi:hypothetical protein